MAPCVAVFFLLHREPQRDHRGPQREIQNRKMKKLTDQDYYFDENGLFVFTAHYHRERGYCCGFECRECPFDYEAVAEPRRSLILEERRGKNKSGEPASDLG